MVPYFLRKGKPGQRCSTSTKQFKRAEDRRDSSHRQRDINDRDNRGAVTDRAVSRNAMQSKRQRPRVHADHLGRVRFRGRQYNDPRTLFRSAAPFRSALGLLATGGIAEFGKSTGPRVCALGIVDCRWMDSQIFGNSICGMIVPHRLVGGRGRFRHIGCGGGSVCPPSKWRLS